MSEWLCFTAILKLLLYPKKCGCHSIASTTKNNLNKLGSINIKSLNALCNDLVYHLSG